MGMGGRCKNTQEQLGPMTACKRPPEYKECFMIETNASNESLGTRSEYLKYLAHSRARCIGKCVNEKESLRMKEGRMKSLNRSIRAKGSLAFSLK